LQRMIVLVIVEKWKWLSIGASNGNDESPTTDTTTMMLLLYLPIAAMQDWKWFWARKAVGGHWRLVSCRCSSRVVGDVRQWADESCLRSCALGKCIFHLP
jgi:hypothetical protein